MRAVKAARVRLAAAAATALVLSGPATAAAMPGGSAPAGNITGVQATAGRVEFVLSARNLPAGTHLDATSLRVTADGRPLTASAHDGGAEASTTQLPVRATVLVLDLSGSMAGGGLAAARQAALGYARSLPADVRVGLVTFADHPSQVLAPTVDRGALAGALARTSAGGDTALYDGVITAAQELAGLPPTATRRLLVLSDGDDTASSHPLSSAVGALAAAHLPTDVVAFHLTGTARTAVSQLAAAAGGRVLPAASAVDLAGAFSAAAGTFTERLSVSVAIPDALAGKHVALRATVLAGAQEITAGTEVDLFAVAPAAPARTDRGTVAAPRVAQSPAQLVLLLALTFCGLLGLALLLLWRPTGPTRRDRLADVERYRVLGAPGLATTDGAIESQVTKAALSAVDRMVRARGMRERIAANLERAGIRMRPQEWTLLQISASTVLGAALFFLAGSLLAVPIGALLGWLASRAYLQIRTARRVRAFGEQLPDVLQLLAGSLRSGFSLSQSLDGVVREGAEPAAAEFARALTEARLGMNLEDALDGVAQRMRCRDLSWVVEAIRISREVGGNLAEVLLTTVTTMRERAQVRRQVRTLSAEGRLSAWILVLLPIVVGGWLFLVRREYLRPLYSSGVGIVMLAGAGLLVGFGSWWMSRVVKVEV